VILGINRALPLGVESVRSSCLTRRHVAAPSLPESRGVRTELVAARL